MNSLAKAGLAVLAIGGGAVAVHHVARAADPAPATAKAQPTIKLSPLLEAHIRALARAHAAEVNASPALAEEHVMKMLEAHLAQVAKDPALVAQVNQVMAAVEAGDKDAIAHIEQIVVQSLHGNHH